MIYLGRQQSAVFKSLQLGKVAVVVKSSVSDCCVLSVEQLNRLLGLGARSVVGR